MTSQKRYVNIALLLLENGADLNVKTSTGKTALYYACKAESYGMVAALIRKGADLNSLPANVRVNLVLGRDEDEWPLMVKRNKGKKNIDT